MTDPIPDEVPDVRASTDVHVVPINDTMEHLQLRQCWCRPTLEHQLDDSALVIHSAADAREHFETD